MNMENYTISLPSYSVGDSVYSKIPEICAASGKSAVICGGAHALAAAENKIKANAENIAITGVVHLEGAASEKRIRELCENDSFRCADMVFAVGGGRALDTAKAAAELCAKPVFTFPTVASTCAATTAVSILYRDDGSFLRPFFLVSPPSHAFIDTGIIAAAPPKYMWAGLGDTFAKYYEAGMSAGETELPHYIRLGCEVSRMCAGPIFRYGARACEDNRRGISSYELEQTVLAIIVSTGIASILLTAEHTADYNSGAAHAIFYALTSLPHIEENHLHGEVVAFGVLLLLLVWGRKDEFRRVHLFMKSVGLPVSPADIELDDAETEGIITAACGMPDVRVSAVAVTPDKLREAFAALKKYNDTGAL